MKKNDASESSTDLQKPPKNGLVFYNIDNQVFVFVNDSIIYESEVIYENPDLYISVDLNPYLTEKENTITVKLRNKGCDGCHHNYWYISYGVFQDGDEVDYVYEDAKRVAADEGIMYEGSHTLYLE